MVTIDCTAYGPVIGKDWAVTVATDGDTQAEVMVRADSVAGAVIKAVMYAAKRGFGPETTTVISCESR